MAPTATELVAMDEETRSELFAWIDHRSEEQEVIGGIANAGRKPWWKFW